MADTSTSSSGNALAASRERVERRGGVAAAELGGRDPREVARVTGALVGGEVRGEPAPHGSEALVDGTALGLRPAEVQVGPRDARGQRGFLGNGPQPRRVDADAVRHRAVG